MSEESEPHIHQVGAFDPVNAFGTTVHRMIALLAAAQASPGALPPAELLRAVQVCLDTMEAVCETTCRSLMASFLQLVSEEDWRTHMEVSLAEVQDRSPEQMAQRQLELLRSVSSFVPVEVPPKGEPDGPTTT